MRPQGDIKELAKFQFRQRYGMCVGAALLFALLGGWSSSTGFNFNFNYNGGDIRNLGISPEILALIITVFWVIFSIAVAVSIFVGGPVTVGHAKFSSCIYVGVETSVEDMFRTGFRDYGRNVGGMLWMNLFIWLWSLLFVIPGIVKRYAYFAAPYILAEFPYVRATEAIKISMRMTDGYKGDIFIMSLSFIGWQILSALTFGLLGILYVNPYYYTSMAGMYQELKVNALMRGSVRYGELMGYPAPPGYGSAV